MKQIRAWFRAHAGALIGLSAVLGVCLLRFALGLPCPVEHLTGIPCPGCGMTRGLWSLLRLDFAAAWQYHPAAFALPPAALLCLGFLAAGRKRAAYAVLWGFFALLMLVYVLRLAV